jgi:hypothetical protein
MQDEVAWADQAAKTDPVKIIWDIPEHKHQGCHPIGDCVESRFIFLQ